MRKVFSFKLLPFFVLLSNFLFSQAGEYYNSISSSSPTFINDLKTRIRNPYYHVWYSKYDETVINEFASRDTLDGKKVVTCAYSGENYIYTLPFTWTYFSREHTWCYSWMPTYGSEDGPEYSDQHHLFPTNQLNANQARSNHPLGNVSEVLSAFREAKFGKDANGRLVYEPRSAHKGDAARALLYMCIRYDGVNGKTWNFNWLNGTRMPENEEAPQDLATLLQWHKQDPPDKWEVDRNNYIQSVQQNRNPFVDHPEYVNYIDFNNLTMKSPLYAKEPAYQASNLSASANDSTVIISWTDARAGDQVPSGYLLMAFARDNYFIPADGSAYPDDADLSDGRAVVNIPFSAGDSYTFKKLKPAADYYFTMYAYNGQADQINYKINDTVKTTARTTGQPETKVFFSAPASASVKEGSGLYALNVYIIDPSPASATAAEIALTSGDSTDINKYSIQKVTFPAGSSLPLTINVTVTDDTLREPDETLVFSIQNVSGGNAARAGTPGMFSLTIKDNDNGGSSGGGLENFAGFPETGMSYTSNTFTGKDGSAWTYTNCSGNSSVQISPPSPVLKKFDSSKDAALAKIQSGSISGGCGFLSFKYMQAFTSTVNLGVYVNNTLITSVTTTSAEKGIVKTAGPFSVDIEGNFTIKLEQMNSFSGQVTVDDITWTGYGTTSVGDNYPALQPETFSLSQNYPNPFNPETSISYALPENSHVTLRVYDMMGKEIAVLVNENKPAGHYRIKFNAQGLSSGMYILRMQAGEFIKERKLALVK